MIEGRHSTLLPVKESCIPNAPHFTEEELLVVAKALAAEICPFPGIPFWSKRPQMRAQLLVLMGGTLVVLLCIFSLACAAVATHSPGINEDGVQHTSGDGLIVKSGMAVKHVSLAELPTRSSYDLSFLRDLILWTEDGHMHVLYVDRAIRYSTNHVKLDLKGGHSLEFMAGQRFLTWSDGTRDRVQLQGGKGMAASGGYFAIGGIA